MLITRSLPETTSETTYDSPTRLDLSDVRGVLKRCLVTVTRAQVADVERLLDGHLPIDRVAPDPPSPKPGPKSSLLDY